ncbi:fatty acid hydroxylase domain-containing protein 2-like isoform X1 [Macrobrachium nipponense]|uniref:fatty acid hydroxylase domain-containing protein 2-like isoform X1 n=2 Tax=Macrobrachium nipponense TaxID=159736 RepID=UPI0030C8311B
MPQDECSPLRSFWNSRVKMPQSNDQDAVTSTYKGGGYSGAAGSLWSTVKKALVILTSLLVVLLALRNTITYHLQHFWGASGNFWQLQWDKFRTLFGNDDCNVLVYGGTLATYAVYWIAGSVYTFMDVTGIPAFIRQYKVQPGTNEPVETRKLIKCILVVQLNQLVVGVAFSRLVFYLGSLRGYDASPHLPTFHWFLFELAVCVLVEEIAFYYSHRLFHHKSIYKHFHKIHHEWQSPIAITALYAHPLEHILSNMAPVIAGPLILGSHPATFLLWSSLAVFSTVTVHSGYHLPFSMSPEFHDFHHLKFNQCYGVLGLLDHLHGTDDKFRASRNYNRHMTMLSLTPPRQMFPDEPNGKCVRGKQE